MRRLLIFLVLGAILGVSGFAQGEVVVDCEGGEENRLIDGDSECGGPFEGDPKEELGNEIDGEKSEVELDADPHSSDDDAASPEEEVEVELSPYIYPELNGLDAEDPVLIEALREKVLIFPPKKKRPIKHRWEDIVTLHVYLGCFTHTKFVLTPHSIVFSLAIWQK